MGTVLFPAEERKLIIALGNDHEYDAQERLHRWSANESGPPASAGTFCSSRPLAWFPSSAWRRTCWRSWSTGRVCPTASGHPAVGWSTGSGLGSWGRSGTRTRPPSVSREPAWFQLRQNTEDWINVGNECKTKVNLGSSAPLLTRTWRGRPLLLKVWTNCRTDFRDVRST